MAQIIRVTIRLVVALLLAAVIGFQREKTHHAAGLRTHLLVALGSALFTLIPLEAGAPIEDVTRVVQGIAAGIGFIGGGVIIKLTDGEQRQVQGLTTAAGIWLTSAIGIAAGLGRLSSALVGIILTWVVLVALEPVEKRLHSQEIRRDSRSNKESHDGDEVP
jgi:putative Mg2+ transporter-C (MgtC) family protein